MFAELDGIAIDHRHGQQASVDVHHARVEVYCKFGFLRKIEEIV